MKDINVSLRDMIRAIEKLKEIYARENAALESLDTQAFLSLQDEKFRAAKNYQALAEEIMARREEIKSADAGLKGRLLEMDKEFFALAGRNVDAISRMRRSVERLGSLIMRAAKDAAKATRAVAYGDNGILKSNDRKIVSSGVIETA